MNREEKSERQDALTRQQLLNEAWWTAEFLKLMKPGSLNQVQITKGRRLTDRGQVVIQSINNGSVDSVVFDAAGGVKKVTLWMMDLEDDWEIVFRILASNDLLFSRILTNEYPIELDELLQKAGIHLIPTTVMDLDFKCDCTSGTHICSHIVATYLTLGKYINENPFILFQLRGRSREEVIIGVDSYSKMLIDTPEETDLISNSGLPSNDERSDPHNLARYYEPGPKFENIRIISQIDTGKEEDIFRLLGPSSIKLGNTDLADIVGETYQKNVKFIRKLTRIENK